MAEACKRGGGGGFKCMLRFYLVYLPILLFSFLTLYTVFTEILRLLPPSMQAWPNLPPQYLWFNLTQSIKIPIIIFIAVCLVFWIVVYTIYNIIKRTVPWPVKNMILRLDIFVSYKETGLFDMFDKIINSRFNPLVIISKLLTFSLRNFRNGLRMVFGSFNGTDNEDIEQMSEDQIRKEKENEIREHKKYLEKKVKSYFDVNTHGDMSKSMNAYIDCIANGYRSSWSPSQLNSHKNLCKSLVSFEGSFT